MCSCQTAYQQLACCCTQGWDSCSALTTKLICCAVSAVLHLQARAELLAAKAATSNAEKAARAAREEERQRAWQQQQVANAQRAAEVAADRVKAKQAQVRATATKRMHRRRRGVKLRQACRMAQQASL
jgi:hypothetical protein